MRKRQTVTHEGNFYYVDMAFEREDGETVLIVSRPNGEQLERAIPEIETDEGKAARVAVILETLEGIDAALNPSAGTYYGSQHVLLADVSDYAAELFQELVRLDEAKAREFDPEFFEGPDNPDEEDPEYLAYLLSMESV